MVSVLSFRRNLDLKGNRGAGIRGVGLFFRLGDTSGDATGLGWVFFLVHLSKLQGNGVGKW